MPHTLFLVPSAPRSASRPSRSVSSARSIAAASAWPFSSQSASTGASDNGPERSTAFVRKTTLCRRRPDPLRGGGAAHRDRRTDELFDRVMRGFHESLGGADVVVVEGLRRAQNLGRGRAQPRARAHAERRGPARWRSGDAPVEEFEARLDGRRRATAGWGRCCRRTIVNRVRFRNARRAERVIPTLAPSKGPVTRADFNVIGSIPQNPELMACRTIDIARHSAPRSCTKGKFKRRGKKNHAARAHHPQSRGRARGRTRCSSRRATGGYRRGSRPRRDQQDPARRRSCSRAICPARRWSSSAVPRSKRAAGAERSQGNSYETAAELAAMTRKSR